MYEPMTYKDRVVWITGASSGIGEALAIRMAERGAKLILSARNQAELNRVACECDSKGAATALVLPLDIAEHASLKGKAGDVLEQFGHIDFLLNNAGVSQRSFCVDTAFTVYEQMFSINVLGQIALTQAVLPAMVARGEGHIAVTASIAGKLGAPQRTGYCAAKHAVMGFFDALRTEVAGDGIRVTTITPGFIRTNVAVNALDAAGERTGKEDPYISDGMDVGECARVIMEGLADGIPEIAVGSGAEMDLVRARQEDPIGTFKLLAAMATQIRSAQPSAT
ncbi:MAG: SDR family oxidoreductase [Pseudomonadota bacterium]